VRIRAPGPQLIRVLGRRKELTAMHALSIHFHLPQDTDWQAIRQLMRERAELYSGVEGLAWISTAQY